MIIHITREDYARMLREGRKFRDWSLYEPSQSPDTTYYVIDMGAAVLNKVETVASALANLDDTTG